MQRRKGAAAAVETFDEKEFYLDEFRGHALLFALAGEDLDQADDHRHLAAIVRELAANDTRVIVLVGGGENEAADRRMQRLKRSLTAEIPAGPAAFEVVRAAAPQAAVPASALLASVWEALRAGPLFVALLEGAGAEATMLLAAEIAVHLRVQKLVLVDRLGGVAGDDGNSLSFMDENDLSTLCAVGQAEWVGMAGRRPTLEIVRRALVGGVRSVNLCTLAGAGRELFTYSGSGTLFTYADYVTVERLGIDDFEEVERLIERGQREGLLKVRTKAEINAILLQGYGATIGAHHFAGICALLVEPYREERAGEIVGLYTITRFKGEGVGGRLVAKVLADARAAGLTYVFACTTEDRAQTFFLRQGFRRATTEEVPAAKWSGYDPARKAQLAVFRIDLA